MHVDSLIPHCVRHHAAPAGCTEVQLTITECYLPIDIASVQILCCLHTDRGNAPVTAIIGASTSTSRIGTGCESDGAEN